MKGLGKRKAAGAGSSLADMRAEVDALDIPVSEGACFVAPSPLLVWRTGCEVGGFGLRWTRWTSR